MDRTIAFEAGDGGSNPSGGTKIPMIFVLEERANFLARVGIRTPEHVPTTSWGVGTQGGGQAESAEADESRDRALRRHNLTKLNCAEEQNKQLFCVRQWKTTAWFSFSNLDACCVEFMKHRASLKI